MKYIVLLRGINAGQYRRVEMKKLKKIFETLGYSSVFTYINSGNVIFEANKNKAVILREIKAIFNKEFDFEIPTLIKTKNEIQKIAKAIPQNWQNDTKQRTDVAYLFDEIDSKNIIDKLPVNREYIDIRYIKGAIFWNLDRKNYNKSHLNKLIGHESYQFMTVRNVNTARFLAKNNSQTVKIDYINPNNMAKPRGYSHAVAVSGNRKTIYIGGQNAVDENGNLVGKGDLKKQTEQTLLNIEKILQDANAKLTNIVKFNIHILQGQNAMDGFQAFQQKWGAEQVFPAITVLFVAGLGNPEWLVEIDAIAEVFA